MPPPNGQPPPYVTTSASSGARKPWWQRWWAITIAVFFVLAVIGAVSSKKKSTTTASKPAATTVSSATRNTMTVVSTVPKTTTLPSTTTTLPPTTTTTLAPTTTSTLSPTTTTLPAPTVYDGRGDDVIDIAYPGGASAAALFASYQSQSNFIVTGLKNGERTGGLVNEIGNYEGTVLVDTANQLQIKASGPWHIELQPLLSVPSFDKHAEGHGDQVLVYTGARGILAAAHDGTSNFIVRAITTNGNNGLVNEIGTYTGRVPLTAGPAVITIHADGNWTLDIA